MAILEPKKNADLIKELRQELLNLGKNAGTENKRGRKKVVKKQVEEESGSDNQVEATLLKKIKNRSDIEAIKKAIAAGVARNAIADHLGISTATLFNDLRKAKEKGKQGKLEAPYAPVFPARESLKENDLQVDSSNQISELELKIKMLEEENAILRMQQKVDKVEAEEVIKIKVGRNYEYWTQSCERIGVLPAK
ncbi:hypothetical protein [Listeria ilorinensis]|uniref:hypothetical protein n=1 Tax=Listeria ilorinensis TaxID=2867439 RepID=UPI001EF557D2|nr:hypothetical protein [Listeria ilorinensis]